MLKLVAPLPRRTTRGPLDLDEYDIFTTNWYTAADNFTSPLSASDSSPALSLRDPSPTGRSVEPGLNEELLAKKPHLSETTIDSQLTATNAKDFSFLLDAAIYHPLGQIDIPIPFRQPFSPPPAPNTPIDKILADLEILLSNCNFIGAAHLSGLALTSGIVSPTDANSIFHLLSIRYASLELSGNVLLAAQEAKALEDLSSTFYYVDETLPIKTSNLPDEQRSLPDNVVPFDLRLQALRLQSIGFSDSRRGVTALYDLGLECRERIASPFTAANDVTLWERRLDEVGIRVVNALIEQGDLDCAYRTLDSMKPNIHNDSSLWISRMIMLCVKMGKIDEAATILETSEITDSNKILYHSIVSVAKGEYNEATRLLSSIATGSTDDALHSIAKQNLACAHLYSGQISECRKILEGLVDDQQSFQTLTINLATVYELGSDKARDMKATMANRVAAGIKTAGPTRAYINSDFKL